jgi:hypothetical protein
MPTPRSTVPTGRPAIVAALLAGWLTALSPATGQATAPAAPPTAPAPAAGDLPDARQLIETAINAMGGRSAFKKVQSTHIKGALSNPMMGSMSVESYAAGPDKFLIRRTMPGGVETSAGSDGQVAWMQNPSTGGYELIPEAAVADFRQEAAPFELLLHVPQQYPVIETVGQATFASEPCHKVRLADPAGGHEQFMFFSNETGRVRGVEQQVPSPQGPTTVSMIFNEWEKQGPLMVFTKITVDQAGLFQLDMSFDEIELNAVDPAVFALPEQVRSLQPPPTTAPDTDSGG